MRPFPPAEYKLLVALNRYHYLLVEQALRLLYSPGAKTYVQSAFKRLYAAGYVERFVRPMREPTGGKPAFVYVLTEQGYAVLRKDGHAVTHRPVDLADAPSYFFLDHHLAVNEVMMTFELLARGEPRLTITALIHDRDLQLRPYVVHAYEGERIRVVPDAWMNYDVGTLSNVGMALELDRGTERQDEWRKKIRGIAAWLKGPYLEAFGAELVTIPVVTTGGDTRLANLIHWTERELTRINAPDVFRTLFLFTTMSAKTDPRVFYLTPHWTELDTRTRVPLIQL